MTRICFVRHGETAWNTERRLQGHLDIPLNERGRAQAAAAAEWLREQPVAAVYSSDLARAAETARHIASAQGLGAMLETAFRERRYGVFEGLTYDEAQQRYPDAYARFQSRQPDYAFAEGGETLQEFSARISARLQQVAAAHPGQLVVIVAHGGVLDVVNRFVRQAPLDTPRDFIIPNAGLNWLRVDGDGWQIEAWGQTEHLDNPALDELRFA